MRSRAAEIEDAVGLIQARGPAIRVLKEDVKSSVYAGVALGGRPACLKVYFQRRRGRRGWENLRRFHRLGVPVPEPLIFAERTALAPRGAVVAMEDLAPRVELDRWLVRAIEAAGTPQGVGAALGPVAAALGALLRDLHARGLYLDDLKTCNVFIDAGGPSFRFVDLDGARRGPVSLKLRARTLAQLNRSTPLAAGIGVRRAFWREYRRGLPRGWMRRLRRLAVELSAERPILYVAPEGVREEPWPARARAWPR